MVDTIASTEKEWYGVWANITLRFDLHKFQVKQMNLVANRGIPPAKTDYGVPNG